jgi:hypothetical protein
MKTTLKLITAICLAGTLGISGCQKGDQGPKGDQGTPGNNGVSNIMSFTLTTTPSSWGHVGTIGQAGDGWQTTFSVSALTSNIITNGGVMLYLLGNNVLTAMPVTLYEFQNVSHTYGFDAYVGQIKAYVTDSDFNTLQPSTNINFKLVIIPQRL